MILDFEQEMTAAGGQLFNAADTADEYGSIPYDLKAAGIDVAVGEPVYAFAKVHDANVNNVTSLDFEIVSSSTGAAGGSENSLCKKETVLLASLTRYAKIHIGTFILSESDYQYIVPKVTTNGTPATTGKIKIWLQKGADSVPVNPGV